MNKLTEKVFEIAPFGYFSYQDVATLFPGSDHRRYGLVKRAITDGQILHIRRGLYCLAPKYRKKPINLFALAQHIYGPSYISMESALSWHGWIPEAVYAVTNVSLKKSKTFSTPLGEFVYRRVRQQIFYAGVERHISEDGDMFLMASPIKALADYVYVNKQNWTGLKPVIKSLRIEPEELDSIGSKEIDRLIDNYNTPRVRKFLDGLGKDLRK